jgi:hypothetical protein
MHSIPQTTTVPSPDASHLLVSEGVLKITIYNVDAPSQDASETDIATANLIQVDGVPFVQITHLIPCCEVIATLPIADAERLAFRVLDLVLSTKEPIVDPIAARSRAHLGTPPPFAPIAVGEVPASC